MSDRATFVNEEQALAALEALGFSQNQEDTEKRSREFLIGSLLAAIEGAAWQDIDRADLHQVHEGYMKMLLALAGNTPLEAARAWVLLLNDRLNRTAVELHEAAEGDGRMFVDVAGPAMLVASNLMQALNHDEITEPMMQETISTAEGNLKKARGAIGEVKQTLRKQGFQLD